MKAKVTWTVEVTETYTAVIDIPAEEVTDDDGAIYLAAVHDWVQERAEEMLPDLEEISNRDSSLVESRNAYAVGFMPGPNGYE